VEEEAVKKTGDSGVLLVATSLIAYVISPVGFPVRTLGMTGTGRFPALTQIRKPQYLPEMYTVKNNTFIIRVE